MRITSEKEFFELIEQAAELNNQVNTESKEVKEFKEALKIYMLENEIETAEAGNFKVTLSETVRSDIDEDKLIELIKNKLEEIEDEDEYEMYSSLIEYKPTINSTLLEDLIYNGKIENDFVLPAVINKVSNTMRFGKASK